jgi:ubiquitin C-terminal hydrolase
MMMGSSEAVPEKPVYDKKGADDTTNEEEQLVYPKGLKNLGNTCYMYVFAVEG